MTLAELGIDLDRVLFDEAPVGLAFLDRDLRYLRVNKALAAINGVPIEGHIGRTVDELLPDLDPRVLDGLQAVLETGVPVEDLELEAETLAAPGVVRTFVEAFRPVRDREGSIVGLMASIVEITELRRAEAETRHARAAASILAALNGRLAGSVSLSDAARQIVDVTGPAFGAMTSGLFLLDDDGLLRSAANRGYSDEIARGFGAWPYDTPSPTSSAMHEARVLVWPTLDTLEAEFPDLAAAMRDVTGERAIASAPLIVDGAPIGALHVGFGTPRKLSATEVDDLRAIGDVAAQAIRRLRLVEAERRARRLLEATVAQMPLGIAIADANGALLIQNDATRRFWGGTRGAGSVDQWGVFRGYHADGRPYEPEEWPLARSIATGEVIVGEEVEIEAFDGERRILDHASAPVRDDDGRILGGVVILRDVTEDKERSALRDAFIGMLSHELRTPITSIYGIANLLHARGEGMDGEIRAGLVEDVRAESDRLFRLVENLLVLARAERGATRIDAAPVLLHRLIPRIVGSEAVSWPSLQLTVSGPEHLPPVRADEGFVDLILRNLVGNAAKYAPGPVEIALSLGEGEILVDVRDGGAGIPEAELDHVFELFRRAPRPSDRHVPGSGIGLFVVRHLAEAMGGRAWARNRPEGGADVGFSLPIDPESV